MHVVVPTLVLVLLWRYRRSAYARWRNVFLVILAIGLLSFWAYPVMPPHILTDAYHVVDTNGVLRIGQPLPDAVLPTINRWDIFGFSNPYAAMPSLHIAFALFAALAAWPLLARRIWRCAVLAYPLAMYGAVTITGNHWFFDAIGGCLTVAAAYVLVRLAERATRHRRQRSSVLVAVEPEKALAA
jgi:hypothetical protein